MALPIAQKPERVSTSEFEPKLDLKSAASAPALSSLVKRPAVAVNQFFVDHPFWGEPADDPSAIMVREWGVKVRDVAKRACRASVRPAEVPSSLRIGEALESVAVNGKVNTKG